MIKIKYEKVGKQYVLLADYEYHNYLLPNKLAIVGFIEVRPNILLIKAGFKWDGPSGFLTVHTENGMRGSLVHDPIYTLIKEGIYPKSFRKQSDKILVEICREDGMSWLRSSVWYIAVRMYGWRHL